MRIAKVIVLAVSGQKNRIHNLGDEVNENMFPLGRFDELIQGGFIELVGQDEVPVTAEVEQDVVVKTKDFDDIPQGLLESVERKMEIPEEMEVGIEDSTRKEMMAALDLRGVKYSKNASKQELYELFRKSKK